MAGADAEGRCGGRRAVVGLLALALTGGCGAATTRDDASGGSLDVPPAVSAAYAPPAPRAPQTATRIDRISVESAPPTTRVVMQLDGSVEPEVSLLENKRLVIDVPGTTCASLPRIVEAAGDTLVERVRTGQHGPPENKCRIVVDLRQRADFSVRAQGDRIVAWLSPSDAATAPAPDGNGGRILFGAESGAAHTTAPSPEALEPTLAPPPSQPSQAEHAAEPAPRAPEPVTLPATELAPSPTTAPVSVPAFEPEPEPTRVVTPEPTPAAEPTLVATSAPEPILVTTPTLEPSPAATPELIIEATAQPAIEPVVVAPAEPPLATPEAAPASTSEPVATPVADQPTDRPTPGPSSARTAAPTTAAAASAEPTRTAASKRVSIDFTEADVRTVVELIASAGGYRVLFTPEVGGTVTISLVDRPWEDALATVLRAKRLREVRHEDVMLVSPAGR